MSGWRALERAIHLGSLAGREALAPPGFPPAPWEPAEEIRILGEALRVEVRRLFRGSLKLRHLDAGSCNACESELQALLNPFYDLQRFGVDVVASPRHADGLLVTGPVTRHLEEALALTIEATPRPRWLIAVGDCACDGGFCRDSFAVRRGLSDAASIDLAIPGCPPRPAEILRALLEALGRESVRAAVAAAAPAAGPA